MASSRSRSDVLAKLLWNLFGLAVTVGLLIGVSYASDTGWPIVAGYLIGWLHTTWIRATDAG